MLHIPILDIDVPWFAIVWFFVASTAILLFSRHQNAARRRTYGNARRVETGARLSMGAFAGLGASWLWPTRVDLFLTDRALCVEGVGWPWMVAYRFRLDGGAGAVSLRVPGVPIECNVVGVWSDHRRIVLDLEANGFARVWIRVPDPEAWEREIQAVRGF